VSWKSKPSWYPLESEASMETSAEFCALYGAIVDALTATVLNAEAGINWLRAQPPDSPRTSRGPR